MTGQGNYGVATFCGNAGWMVEFSFPTLPGAQAYAERWLSGAAQLCERSTGGLWRPVSAP